MIASLAGEQRTSKVWAIALFCASVVSILGLARPAVAQDELRIAEVLRPAGADAEVIVSVPRALSGRTLPASAFAVTVDGNPVRATVAHEAGRGYEVALVIETSATAEESRFVATKAAAVEFVLRLLSETRVAILASDPPAVVLDYTSDRAAVVRAIRDLKRTPGSGLVTALDLAARNDDAQHHITLVAAATAGVATVPEAALMGEQTAALRRASSQVYAVGVVSEPLAQLAADSGGVAHLVDDRQLVGAFDSVVADLNGRYRLTLPMPSGATRLDVRVSATEGSATAAFAMSPQIGKAIGTPTTTAVSTAVNGVTAARSTDDADDSSTARVAFVLGLFVVGLAITFVALRLQNRREPSLLTPVAAAPSAIVAASPPPPPPPPPVPLPLPPEPELVDLVAEEVGAPDPLAGYTITALCGDLELAELRAALASYGVVITQVTMVDEALRDVVAGRTRAVYLDSAMPQARDLATAVRQRNDARWSTCRLLLHVSNQGISDPTLMAMADAIVTSPIVASHVVELLAKHVPTTARSIR